MNVSQRRELQVLDGNMKQIKKFKYMANSTTNDRKGDTEIQTCIGMTKYGLKAKQINMRQKRKLETK